MRIFFADSDLAAVERYKAVGKRQFVARRRKHIRTNTRSRPWAHARTRTDANTRCVDFDVLAWP